MRTRIRTACTALALAGVTAGGFAGTAQAGKKFESARFKVTAKGTQNVTWAYDHPDGGTCDIAFTGSGFEKVKFKTKPIVVEAFKAPGQKNPVLLANDGLIELKGTATLNRDERINWGPAGPEDGINCPGGGSGDPDPQKDCGMKKSPWKFQLYYDYVKKERLVLAGINAQDPYKHCNASGEGFPYFTGDNYGTQQLPKLPANELFDDSTGQITVIGRGKSRIRSAEFESDGKLQWDVEFKRLKGKPRG